jgi:hypothetical protein
LEVVSVVGNAISVQIASGASTATQVKAAIDADVAGAALLVSVAITGTPGTAQVTASAVNLAGGHDAAVSGYFYRVNVAGTKNLGSGSQTFVVGDWVMYDGSVWQLAHAGADVVISVNGQTGPVSLDSDDIGEGSTNQYFLESRVRSTVLTGFTGLTGAITATDSVLTALEKLETNKFESASFTDAAVTGKLLTGFTGLTGTVGAGDSILSAIEKLASSVASMPVVTVAKKENLTLITGDINAQYIDLLHIAEVDTLALSVNGVMQYEGLDYSLSTVSSKTRITFLGELATAGAAALVAGDILRCQYRY